ncbi:MAG: cob(I)yrinic acid a,c-diamide adenosyltransferase [Anaerolineae bacterium]|nr:cob(I)yrinic acid a,c-diamide adenosyltransferase [Anaerolineae bacterium]
MKIYTRTGDSGDTGLFGGGRVRKHHVRVEAYGTVDELNSWLGVVRAGPLPEQARRWLETVQNDLFRLGSDLATPLDTRSAWVMRIEQAAVEALEQAIDSMDEDLPPLTSFILPGGTPGSAALHVARTVCRRAERVAVALADVEAINPVTIAYLNRLSDFLFTLARWVNLQAGQGEVPWSART